MRCCTRAELTCILPLGVAVNSVGKLRLIWDGRHVKRHLPRDKFRMETRSARAGRCPRLLGAHCLFAGRATPKAYSKSHGRPAPASPATWRAALGAWPAVDRAQLDHSIPPLMCGQHFCVGSNVRVNR